MPLLGKNKSQHSQNGKGKDHADVISSKKISSASGTNLIQVLRDGNLITEEQIDILKKESEKEKKPLEQVLLDLRFISDENLARAKEKLLGIPYVSLEGKKVSKDVLNIIPPDAAKNYGFVVFGKEGNILKVAMTNPQDFQALEALDFIVRKDNYQSQIFLTTYAGFESVLRQYSGMKEEVGRALESATLELEKGEEEVVKKSGKDLERFVEQAPVARAINVIVRNAVEAGASDIHLEPTEKEIRVRYRVDGILQTMLTLSRQIHAAIVSRVKILTNLKIDETRIPQDGRFHMKVDSREIDFRVSTLPTISGEKVVMRILDRSAGVFKLETLGLTGLRLATVEEATKKSHGMFLVTGPTGAGKSTTLYSILGILNEPAVNIVTLEDPVEYFIQGISQAQVNPDVGLTFASGLRSILRQDPDIIMVGEIRDKETAEMAVHAALTGHVVLSTLHTNSSFGAIPRLIDMGIEPFLLASSLNIVVAQRLVRKLCQNCKVKRKATPDEIAIVMKEWENIPQGEKRDLDLKLSDPIEVHEKVGCPKCKDGYKGRIGIFEVLSVSEKIQDAILKKSSAMKIKDIARDEGLITMMEDGIAKIIGGITTVDEVLRATRE
ncbi:MAG: hypothetical protein ACD_63C00026G0004 [uncultured bacterium]|nr:MAG: hypothetical protein ACD_63C00026G0004 [uncultured bacterium]